jgi:hypothetical protein
MNKLIKELAMKSYETVKNNPKLEANKPEALIDAYVLEMTRNVVFKCSDIVRDAAKNADPEVARSLKVAAVDMLDEFGL